MAQKDLVTAIGKKYSKMSRTQRIKTIRGLSEDVLKFIRRFFPDFYAEAFPAASSSAGGPLESDSHSALYAKSR